MVHSTVPAPSAPADGERLLDAARALLLKHYGYPDFRPPQTRVVRSVLSRRDALAILPTGAGKSVCFQIPALLLPGLTLVISPLIALMQDQVDAARARGIPAALLTSLQRPAEQHEVWQAVVSGTVKLLYVAPERLGRLVPRLLQEQVSVSLLAIDEAHCISEWGDDFRPAYRTLRAARRALGWPRVVALTGTATDAVQRDIVRTLGIGQPGGYDLHQTSFDRPNLWFGVVPVRSETERLHKLTELLASDDRIAIVYAPTRNLTEEIARVLRDRGYRARAYHAGLAKGQRRVVLEAFLAAQLEVVVATCAFGMGIDQPNVRLVVHWIMSPTPEAYYQEAGRAGRDGRLARCILLYRRGDAALARRELDVTFPDEQLVERVWASADAGLTLSSGVKAAIERLRHELKPERGRVDWSRVRARRRMALERIATVERYAEGTRCRRVVLLEYFGQRLARCAGCDRCGEPAHLPPLAADASRRLRTLRVALGTTAAPWRGCLLDPRTLLTLAVHPPDSLDALAGVPGIGPAFAARYGAMILDALSSERPTKSLVEVEEAADLAAALRTWRAGRARELAVARFQILTDRALEAIAQHRPGTVRELAAVAGLGPRALAVHGEELLAVVSRYLPPAPGGA